jgi:tetratricopeptide (TPR) repeat protein
VILSIFFVVALAASAIAQGPMIGSDSGVQSGRVNQDARQDADYESGMRALDARQWDQAIASFNSCMKHDSNIADAALYWKAYAQYRAGRYENAVELISDLRSDYPSSKWVKDAKALEVEVKGQTGAPMSPNAESDDDLKLIALNSLMQSDPEKAISILQKLLSENGSEKIKERALFVLAQSSSPDAKKMLGDMAQNSANRDLQIKAIRYMGMMGGADARKELASVYSSSSDVRLKRAILQSFMTSGSRDFVLNAAKTEQNPELRRDAIRQLAMMGAQDELWQLYQGGTLEDKKTILQSMFMGGNSERLVEVARTEKDPALRAAAIKSLGLMGHNGRGDVLVSIYQSDQDRGVREAVLNSLFLQQNGKALVDLARAEKDPEMKKRIIEKMALIHTKETTDYMMELLK